MEDLTKNEDTTASKPTAEPVQPESVSKNDAPIELDRPEAPAGVKPATEELVEELTAEAPKATNKSVIEERPVAPKGATKAKQSRKAPAKKAAVKESPAAKTPERPTVTKGECFSCERDEVLAPFEVAAGTSIKVCMTCKVDITEKAEAIRTAAKAA